MVLGVYFNFSERYVYIYIFIPGVFLIACFVFHHRCHTSTTGADSHAPSRPAGGGVPLPTGRRRRQGQEGGGRRSNLLLLESFMIFESLNLSLFE